MVLLNLLIAIMTSSHNRMGTSAMVVARFQRAKLVLALEPPTGSRIAIGKRHHLSPLLQFFGRCMDFVRGTSMEDPRPQYLHVLTPPEQDMQAVETGEESEVGKKLTALQRAFASHHLAVTQSLDSLAANQKKLEARLASR